MLDAPRGALLGLQGVSGLPETGRSERNSPLPDFYIGAHAAVREYRLLARDASKYRTYFPTVDLIAP